MPVDYVIRPATLDDTRAIAEFQTTTWNEAYAGIVNAGYLENTTAEARAARWGARLAAGERDIRLAERDGLIVAVVSFGERSDDLFGPRLELMSIYLAPSARGTGLSGRLMQETLQGRDAVLWVFEANERAIAFYRREVFVADGNTNFDGETGLSEIRMTRVASITASDGT